LSTITNEIEQYVIGSFIKKPELLALYRARLWPEVFTERRYRMIVKAIFASYDKKEKIVPLLITNMILKLNPQLNEDKWDSINEELEQLAIIYPETSTLEGYITELINKGCSVDGAAKAREIAALAKSGELAPNDFLRETQKIIRSMKAFTIEGDEQKTDTIGNIALQVYKKAQRVRNKQDEGPGFFSGYEGLHKMIGPFREGDVMLLAAVPSMGKTTLAINIALSVAKRGTPTLMFSIEMKKNDVATKVLSTLAKVDSRQIPLGKYNDVQMDNLAYQCSQMADYPLIINEHGRINTSKIERDIIIHRPKFVVIDYLQKIQKEHHNEREALDKISQQLIEMGKEHGVCFLVISSLNGKEIKKRVEKRPNAFDLHGTGSLAYDADFICFLHSDIYWITGATWETEGAKWLEFIIEKQRMGRQKLTLYTEYFREINTFGDFKT